MGRGNSTISAGADARPITPDLDRDTVFLAGFQPDRPAESVHDDLMVRTVAVQSGDDEPVVISVCDLVGLTRVHAEKGQRVVACTHTHHGPDGLGFWGRPFEGVSGIDSDYLERVRRIVAESQDAAIASLEPATLTVGSTALPELVQNHRNPHILDDEVSVLRFARTDGTPIVTFVDYACHPEVFDPEGTEVTADFPGHLCRRIEHDHGGVAVFAVGSIGGMQSPRTEVHTHDEAVRFGDVLADAVADALDGRAAVDAAPVRFARSDVAVTLQNPLYELGMELGLVPQAELRDGAVVTEVAYLRIGSAGLAFVPGEIFPELGLGLKDAMRATGVDVPIVVGLADDEVGYIIPEADFVAPEDYLDPGSSYEESFSAGPDVGPRVVAALEHLITST